MRSEVSVNNLEYAGAREIDPAEARKLLDGAIEAYYEDIRRAVLAQGNGQSQATEVVHDLYIQLCRKPERVTRKNSLRAFLIRSALNLGIDRARRRTFEAKLFQALDDHAHSIPAQIFSADNRIDLPKRIAVLQTAIFALPPQCRKIFVAYRIARMSKEQISHDLSVKPDTVDRNLRMAMMQCMQAMDTFEQEQARV